MVVEVAVAVVVEEAVGLSTHEYRRTRSVVVA